MTRPSNLSFDRNYICTGRTHEGLIGSVSAAKLFAAAICLLAVPQLAGIAKAENIAATQMKTTSEPAGVDLRTLPSAPRSERPPKEAPAPGIPDYRPFLVRDTKLDLAQRLGLDISRIALKSMQAMTWPDSSLGCPQAGPADGHANVEGYKITLTAGRHDYVYHTDARSRFRLCTGADR